MSCYPVFKVDAVPHDNLPSVTKVFSLQEFELWLHVHVPEDIAKYYVLYQVDEVCDKDKLVDMDALVEHIDNRVWYDFNTELLNKASGLHVYRLSMKHKYTNDRLRLFMGYVVQTNDPDKPYYYMANSRKYLDNDTKEV